MNELDTTDKHAKAEQNSLLRVKMTARCNIERKNLVNFIEQQYYYYISLRSIIQILY